MKSPKSDPQRSAVYAWEGGWYLSSRGDVGTAQFYEIIRKVCKRYGVPRPKAGTIPKNWRHFTAVCDYENKALWFDPNFCTAKMLTHELAHWIVDCYGYKGHPHGPVWLGLYLRLMNDYFVMPLDASVPSATKAGLKFTDPTKCTPKNVKRLIERVQASSHLV